MMDEGRRKPPLSSLIVFLIVILLYFLSGYNILLLIAGAAASIYAIYIGADGVVDESARIAANRSLSKRSEGVLILSIAAVADEFFLSVTAAVLGFGNISFGAIQGSNIFTITFILVAAPLFLVTLGLKKFRKDVFYLIGSAAVVLVISLFFTDVPWYYFFPLIAIFLIYFITSARSNIPKENDAAGKSSITGMIMAVALLFIASFSLVTYVRNFSSIMHAPLFITSFLLAGIAGSIPEISIIFITIRRKKIESSIGVMIGSTIYKLTLILGIVTLFGNLVVTNSAWSSGLLIIIAVMLLFYIPERVRRYQGAVIFCIIATAAALLYLLF